MTEVTTDVMTPAQLVAKQLEQLQRLENLLKAEKEVLQKHNPDELTKLTLEKNQQLTEIGELDQFIGTNTAFAQEKSTGNLDNDLEEIKRLLTHCKELNFVNGQIIQQSQIAVERMKTSLFENNNKSGITYDGKGKKSAGLSSLNIKA